MLIVPAVPGAVARRLFTLSLVLVLAACQAHDHPHDDAEPEVAEPPSIAVTAWSDRHEIFAEFGVPLVGEGSRFATHVSDLLTAEPRRTGPVTYHLSGADGSTREVVDPAPARDGIYTTTLDSPSAGTWQLALEVPTPDGADLIQLGAWTVYADEAARSTAPLPEEVDGISYLKEQQWLLGTRTALVERATLRTQQRAPARIQVAPDRAAEVVPPVAGRLTAPDGGSLPRLGEHVDEGQLLGWVQPPVSEALVGMLNVQADLARLEVAVELTEATAARSRLLHEQDARSARDLEQDEFALRAALAERDGARAALDAYEAAGLRAGSDAAAGPPRFAIRAPLAGYVDEVLAVAGQFVADGAPIVRLVDPSLVHVVAQVRAEELTALDPTHAPSLTLEIPGGEPVSLPADAVRIVHAGLRVDERTGRAPLVFAIENPKLRWRPGTSVALSFSTGNRRDVLNIPSSAVIEEDGASVVFVQLGGETFERRIVGIGLHDGERVEIRSGLAEGERVVSDGAYTVRLASVSSTVPAHGHAH